MEWVETVLSGRTKRGLKPKGFRTLLLYVHTTIISEVNKKEKSKKEKKVVAKQFEICYINIADYEMRP
jgi:hypothetical protein